MSAPIPIATLPPFAHKLLRFLGKLIAEKAHARVIVTLRDGKIQYIGLDRTYTPETLPDV